MTKLWIRVDADAPDDPAINELADRLGVDPMQALGHCMALWAVVAKHRTAGSVADVNDATLERWARWTKRRGSFAVEFRALFLDEDDHLHGWDSRQGALIRRAERDRKRHQSRGDSAESGAKLGGVSAEIRRDSPSTVRNGTEQRSRSRSKAPAADAAVPPAGNENSPSPDSVPAAVDPPKNGAAWLQVVAAEWDEKNGAGTFPFGIGGKALKSLIAHHTAEKIAQNLWVYLTQTEPRFVSLPKFAQTFAQWDYQEPVVDGVMTPFGERMTR